MICDNAFVVVLLLLIVSMTGNFYCILRWIFRVIGEAINAGEEAERGS